MLDDTYKMGKKKYLEYTKWNQYDDEEFKKILIKNDRERIDWYLNKTFIGTMPTKCLFSYYIDDKYKCFEEEGSRFSKIRDVLSMIEIELIISTFCDLKQDELSITLMGTYKGSSIKCHLMCLMIQNDIEYYGGEYNGLQFLIYERKLSINQIMDALKYAGKEKDDKSFDVDKDSKKLAKDLSNIMKKNWRLLYNNKSIEANIQMRNNYYKTYEEDHKDEVIFEEKNEIVKVKTKVIGKDLHLKRYKE